MKIFDAHCDVLNKLWEHPGLDFVHGRDSPGVSLDVTLDRLTASGVGVQNFAVYLDEPHSGDFQHVLECVDLFYERILCHPQMRLIRTKRDLQWAAGSDRIGALLSLEGVDGLQGNLTYLRILFQLGVRSVGLTWNYANWAADGVLEPRQGGLTAKGVKLIAECNRLGIILDVSHLSERGFWELAERSAKPFIASHSNADAVCRRRRNLNDGQIAALIRAGGVIGVTFVPDFVSSEPAVTPDRLLSHIDHICSLGGSRHIGLGSDFDGIKSKMVGLEHAGCYPRLINLLQKHYREEEVERFVYRNWHDFYMRHLPE